MECSRIPDRYFPNSLSGNASLTQFKLPHPALIDGFCARVPNLFFRPNAYLPRQRRPER
jgi:hypothetical protein